MNILLYSIGLISVKLESAKKYYLRKHNLRKVGLNETSGVVIGSDVNLSYPEHISIGENTYINGGDLIASKNAEIVIGKNCLISYYVHMRTDMHCYKSQNKLIKNQGHMEKSIYIGNDVWIGYGAQIMSGVKVAEGCVIAAGAIVTHDTEAYGVYAGVPAVKIGDRINEKE